MQNAALQSVAHNVLKAWETGFACTTLKGVTAGWVLYGYTSHRLPNLRHHNVQLS